MPALLKKWGETLDYVSCFSLHFFRARTASCVLYNRTEHSQGFSILLIILHIFFINNTINILFHHQHHLHQLHNHANHNLHKMEEGQYLDLYNILDIQVVKGAVYFSFRGSTPSNKSSRVTSSTSSPLVCHKQAQIFVVLFSFSV